MTGALDDFSLLVSIKTPEDLLQRPLYHPLLNPQESKLAEVLAPYHFDRPHPCGISSCRTPHQSGYLVITEDQKETNIGQICGKKIFGDDFVIKANLQNQRARLKHQLDTLQEVRDRTPELMARIASMLTRDLGAKWAEMTLKAFREAVGQAVFRQLRDKALRGETSVEKVRPATADERELHRQSNPTGRPLQFVSEKIGDLAGLEFLNAYPTTILTSLKDKLFELGALDGKTLAAGPRKAWVDWAGSIEITFDGVETNLTDAARFFSQRNFQLLPALGKDTKEQDRLAQVRWSDSERRVIAKPTR
jgi:hypothetical protein